MDNTHGFFPWDYVAGVAITLVSAISSMVIAYFRYRIERLKIEKGCTLVETEDDDTNKSTAKRPFS